MSCKVLSPEMISTAAAWLRQGELVAMPTETVYGLAGLALDESALAKIFAAKERPKFDPLIVHMAPSWSLDLLVDFSKMNRLARERVELLEKKFWPGPMTLVLPKKPVVPDLATSGLETVAVRKPRHPLAIQLLEMTDAPLAAPSANRFGRISPTSADDVFAELSDRIEFILDGGRCELGLESSVIRIGSEGEVTLLRPGFVTRQDLEATLGCEVLLSDSSTQIASPGLIASHYAPTKSLMVLPKPFLKLQKDELAPGNYGILARHGLQSSYREQAERLGVTLSDIQILSPSGDLAESAQNLFGMLRKLDASNAVTLISDPWTDRTGLAHAIHDRLERASGKKLGEKQ